MDLIWKYQNLNIFSSWTTSKKMKYSIQTVCNQKRATKFYRFSNTTAVIWVTCLESQTTTTMMMTMTVTTMTSVLRQSFHQHLLPHIISRHRRRTDPLVIVLPTIGTVMVAIIICNSNSRSIIGVSPLRPIKRAIGSSRYGGRDTLLCLR